eukprot:CAMPEP_0114244466 /NCGR_PEP_ID=MMETSP0058-20121206/11351_1 /TAXON_ID=36894 /ORGANISM="Pyramimonas parkeae, CCMP726" /LENGTH=436 /DNA_ID=CAMNT_0001357401 /DNA_START=222 /DNA_END=1532 /DNA_ORIENTATION=+
MSTFFTSCYPRCGARKDTCLPYQSLEVVQGTPLQAPLISASLEMKHEIQQLRKEVAELRTCLSEKVRASAIIPRASDAIHQTQSHYTHMQYIPLMMYSGPQPEGLEEAPKYVGLSNMRDDFSARVEVVRKALEKADKVASKDPAVLKVFTLPEFFFRGPIGAYPLQDVLGDAMYPNGFIYQIQQLLEGDRWASWLGIFGTIIAFQIAPGNRYRLHNVYNICLCQHGGFTSAQERGAKCHFVLKHWVSKIDFLDGGEPGDEGQVVKDDEKWLENHQQHYLDGLRAYGRLEDDCLVRVGGISFGLEICLDHRNRRLIKNEATRKYQHNRPVEVQLVISAGMSLIDRSVVVNRKGGLIFINDGLGCNEGAKDVRSNGRLYSHKGKYERLEPDCIEAFDECSSEFTQKLAELFCMENGDSCPTEPLLGVYPVVKVVDVDV